MRHRWATSALLLVFCPLWSSPLSAQRGSQRHDEPRRGGKLGANQPNPFSQETTIPFTVGDDSCAAGAERHVVTLRIYNILSQVVATPVLSDTTAEDSAVAATARPVQNLTLSCGAYTARWNGKHARTGHPAAAGVYMYQLVIDGHPAGMRKMLLKR